MKCTPGAGAGPGPVSVSVLVPVLAHLGYGVIRVAHRQHACADDVLTGPQFEGDFAKGPGLALMFAVSLALANCIGYTMFSAIGIACRSSTIAVQLASVLALYSFLFCGLLVNKSALAVIAHKLSFPSHVLDALPALSFVYRFIETVLVNELGALPRPMIEIKQKHIPGVPKIPDDVPPVSGANVLAFLGFSTGDAPGEHCAFSLPCASWNDVEVNA
uniref:Uncharacterized protein n=1 Tax=Calcidiscus leptoporus TaxID=127549 RepID=A0A7S0J195_9EUKA|mmetsp:Transcript_33234/g.77685  ORF Transcript_33234/g.77685 Transcript_33234/m.77685 type:complete len:217 (+) Transcript_33234:2-652(+)